MKYAILSDVHANPRALQDVMTDARERGVKKFISCGDVTGYGYDARSSVAILREAGFIHIQGNHDEACYTVTQPYAMKANVNYDVDRAQRSELGQEALKWLRTRPFIYENGAFACSHGDFSNPPAFHYIQCAEDAVSSWETAPQPLLFVGHTHSAAIHARGPDGRLYTWSPKAFRVQRGWRYLVNVGAVGYPRRDYMTTYCIYDSGSRQVEFRELPFDFRSYFANLVARRRRLPLWLVDILDLLNDEES